MEWSILSTLIDGAGGTVSVLGLALVLLRNVLKEIAGRQARAEAAFAEFRQDTMLRQQAIIQALNEQKIRLARIEVMIRELDPAPAASMESPYPQPPPREWVL